MIKKIILISALAFVLSINIASSAILIDDESETGQFVGGNTPDSEENVQFTGGNQAPSDGSDESSGSGNQSIEKLQNPLKANSIKELLLLVVDIAIYVGIALSVLAIIYVGFQFVLAQGNSEKISKAREYFFWIIIGLAILISSKVIVEIVTNTLSDAGVVNSEFLK